MAPERDTDVDALGDGAVVGEQGLVLGLGEVEHRGVHDDVVGTDRLGVPRQIDHHIHVGVRAGHDRLTGTRGRLHGQVEGALPLLQGHRVELALFARDEQTLDTELVDPVVDVGSESVLVDGEVLGERGQRGCPDTGEVLAGVVLGVVTVVVHGFGSVQTIVMLWDTFFTTM